MNTQTQKDMGLIAVLTDRHQKQRLPRALALKEKVDRGEVLDSYDTSFLDDVLHAINDIRPILERYPDCQKLATGMLTLCKEIAGKGLANEGLQ